MGKFMFTFKKLRVESGYTQDSLADALGLSRSAISMYENGKREPDFETLERIGDFFRVNIDFLLDRAAPAVLHKADSCVPNYEEIRSLMVKNHQKLTFQQKQDLIRILLSPE